MALVQRTVDQLVQSTRQGSVEGDALHGRATDGSGALLAVPRTSGLQAPIMLLTGHTASVHSVQFSPQGGDLLASGSSDHSVLIWETYGDCNNIMTLRGHDAAVLQVKWLPSGRRLVSASADKTVAVWDVEERVRLKKWKGHRAMVNTCDVSRPLTNPLVVSGDDDGCMLVWDERQKRPVFSLQHDWPVTCVCFNASTELIYSGSVDHQVTAWDMRTASPVYQLTGHQDTVTGLRLSPDGSRLLSSGMDHVVRVWDVKPYSPLPDRCVQLLHGAPHGMDQNLLRPCWSPDGTRVGCGSADHSVVVWEVKKGQVEYKLPGHRGTVNEVDWHPREPIVASGSNDQRIFLGEVKPSNPASRFRPS